MQHPNLVTVFDFNYRTDASDPEGPGSSQAATPPLTLEEKVGIIVRVLNGLHHRQAWFTAT